MDNIDVLAIRSPRFYTDGATAGIFPQEILPPTILENNSIPSRFLNADFVHFNRKFTLYPRLDAYILSKKYLKQFLRGNGLKWKYAKMNIRKFDPKVILLIVRFPSDFSVTLKMAKIAKETNSNIKVGVYKFGNESFQRQFSLKLLKSSKDIDFVIIGEPEYTLLEVSKNLLKGKEISKVKGLALKKNKKILFTKRRELETNLDNFPTPNRDLVIDKKYYPSSSFGIIEGGRGCIYNCNFCIDAGRPFRLRSPINVVKEIAQVYTKYKTREINFAMNSFLHSRKWTIEVCNLIKKFKLDIIFSSFLNINQADRKIIKILKSAGCYSIGFGLESGDTETLMKMNKIMNLNFRKLKNTTKMMKSAGIRLRTGIILNNPGETLEQMMTSLQLLREIKPDFFRVQFLIPYLGTKLYEEVKSKGMLIDEKLDEYHTGEIKIKPTVDPKILREIWIKYAKLSDLSDFIVLRKNLLNSKFLKCKIIEYVKYLTQLIL
jgi:radical SAM superfamily enzyme YgiQ (UPF0313 family)